MTLASQFDPTSESFADSNTCGSGLASARTIRQFQFALWSAALLIVSGLSHLTWLAVTGSDWNGPLSLRKPGLFGVSAGLTVWSLAWVMTQLYPHRWDRVLAILLAGGLLIEVGLITVQHWRGVPSHFNRSTTIDASIEGAMLAMILLVTAGIFWLTIRSWRLPPMKASQAIAIRGGLWLISLACGLGIVVTVLGELNLATGKSYELWGPAGVLKYPHGAALHAIQMLPLISWLLNRLRVPNLTYHMVAVLASQLLFLMHAVWQTLAGHARLDLDAIGGTLLAAAAFCILAPAWALARTSVSFLTAAGWGAGMAVAHDADDRGGLNPKATKAGEQPRNEYLS